MNDLILGPAASQPAPERVKVDGTTGFCVFCGSSVGELYWNGYYMSHLSRSKFNGCKTGKTHDKTARTEDYFIETFGKPESKTLKELLDVRTN